MPDPAAVIMRLCLLISLLSPLFHCRFWDILSQYRVGVLAQYGRALPNSRIGGTHLNGISRYPDFSGNGMDNLLNHFARDGNMRIIDDLLKIVDGRRRDAIFFKQ